MLLPSQTDLPLPRKKMARGSGFLLRTFAGFATGSAVISAAVATRYAVANNKKPQDLNENEKALRISAETMSRKLADSKALYEESKLNHRKLTDRMNVQMNEKIAKASHLKEEQTRKLSECQATLVQKDVQCTKVTAGYVDCTKKLKETLLKYEAKMVTSNVHEQTQQLSKCRKELLTSNALHDKLKAEKSDWLKKLLENVKKMKSLYKARIDASVIENNGLKRDLTKAILENVSLKITTKELGVKLGVKLKELEDSRQLIEELNAK